MTDQPGPLTFATNAELIDELARRHRTLLLGFVNDTPAPGALEYRVVTHHRNGPFELVGLAEAMLARTRGVLQHWMESGKPVDG